MRKASELRQMPLPQLEAEYKKEKEALYALRYQLATHQIDDVKAVYRKRKDIARIATVIREKELEEERAQAGAV